MGQNKEKQQKATKEEKDGNQSIVKKFVAFRKLKHKKTRHRRLPLEMECEIFKFLKLELQQRLICGMGQGIYGIYGQRVLIKVCSMLALFIQTKVFLSILISTNNLERYSKISNKPNLGYNIT
jgi:hypothetical protein